MQKFQNMEHSNSRTFQGLSRAWNFFPKFKDFQGLLKDPMNPVYAWKDVTLTMGLHVKMSLPINFLDKLSLPSHTSTEKNSHIQSSTYRLLTDISNVICKISNTNFVILTSDKCRPAVHNSSTVTFRDCSFTQQNSLLYNVNTVNKITQKKLC